MLILDILYNELSVQEHLELIGKVFIKGRYSIANKILYFYLLDASYGTKNNA